MSVELDAALHAAREQREKATTLHEARLKAHAEMRQAIAQHEFLVTATRHAEETLDDLQHHVETVIRHEAYEALRD